jgi:hypothetical protein
MTLTRDRSSAGEIPFGRKGRKVNSISMEAHSKMFRSKMPAAAASAVRTGTGRSADA